MLSDWNHYIFLLMTPVFKYVKRCYNYWYKYYYGGCWKCNRIQVCWGKVIVNGTVRFLFIASGWAVSQSITPEFRADARTKLWTTENNQIIKTVSIWDHFLNFIYVSRVLHFIDVNALHWMHEKYIKKYTPHTKIHYKIYQNCVLT